ncbi:MAG TPA: long-chain-acyl-CoA synthetase [Terriglobales bacterium]|nr:long-chain-acyl-CoA synthetase [Terriglobales bacterium]
MSANDVSADGRRAKPGRSSSRAWLRALELTASIAANPSRILPTVIGQVAEKFADKEALFSPTECLTYRSLTERSNRYSRWALSQDLAKGEAVCLLMPNRPEYLAVWLGITRVGGVVALLNTNLAGSSLAHCVNVTAPKHIIVAVEFLDRLTSALRDFRGKVKIWIHGTGQDEYARIDREITRYTGETLHDTERRPVTNADRALYVFTSGTTGAPKAANVSHARLMQWSHWFAGIMETSSSDRLYDCLPMYHSVGGVVATGAVLIVGGSVVVREKFSASQFWEDIVRCDCTVFQYIGELCRYLLHAEPHPLETQHRIRMCCGNGLRPDIWGDFQARFRIPQILEFYAATEGNVSMFNLEGKPGALGRIPAYLAHRFPTEIVRCDMETEEPVRNEQGFCLRCAPNEDGEAIGQIFENQSNARTRFEGYTDREASENKILRDVFEPGDAWFRTGDLMRKDENGYFYFVDRIGDTFRWKGENVATSEVSEVMCSFPGIKEAVVYGVAVPGADGRAGMALVMAGRELDLAAFRTHLSEHLPQYAHPLFVRIRDEIEMTPTFKYRKSVFACQGYDPHATSDVMYFNDHERGVFVPLDGELYNRIQACQVRL